jgi:hypothetical protein
MSSETLTQIGTTIASLLALTLSLFNLYLQRRDHLPRLKIRVRYEYRAAPLDEPPEADDTPPHIHIHDKSQEGLYLLLGDFLREYGIEYPEGTPVVRFALSNEGERVFYLESIRLILRVSSRLFGDWMVLDPIEDRMLPIELAQETANVLAKGGDEKPRVELAPKDSIGYRFELTRLANALVREGHTGNVRIVFEVSDRLGNIYHRPFDVNTDLWAYLEG